MKSNCFVLACAETIYQKYSYRLFSFLDKCGFVSDVLSEDIDIAPLVLAGEQDWGEEASGVSWRNDLYRRSKQLHAIDVDGTPEEKEAVDKRRKRLGPPKFSRLHFWGFGWWENVVRNKKKK